MGILKLNHPSVHPSINFVMHLDYLPHTTPTSIPQIWYLTCLICWAYEDNMSSKRDKGNGPFIHAHSCVRILNSPLHWMILKTTWHNCSAQWKHVACKLGRHLSPYSDSSSFYYQIKIEIFGKHQRIMKHAADKLPLLYRGYNMYKTMVTDKYTSSPSTQNLK